MAVNEPRLSAKARQALLIVKEAGIIRPREFAERMWPDSEGWQRMARCGPYGVTQGGGMPPAGGAYLGKLRARGLVRLMRDGHRLADGGYKALHNG